MTLQAASAQEAHANVGFGYLAVALTHFCQSIQPRELIKSLLGGDTLQPLAAALDEFIQYHKRVDGDGGDMEPEQEHRTSFTRRLEQVREGLQDLL